MQNSAIKSNFPRITVLMGVYNEPTEWIQQSINSILTQTFTDYEFIIINDNPESGEHLEFLNSMQAQDSRIVLINNEKNIGLTKSLNKGISIARGEFIARMDADDIADPARFELQLNYMINDPTCVVCGSWMTSLSDKKSFLMKYPTTDLQIKNVLLLKNCIPHPTAFIRTNVLKLNSIFYNESIRYSQDYELWCNLSRYGTLRNLEQPLLQYRISDQQISTKRFKEQSKFARTIRTTYLNQTLNRLNLNNNNDSIPARIKGAKLEIKFKQYLLTSYYSDLSIKESILSPLVNGDILIMKQLYFSSIKISRSK